MGCIWESFGALTGLFGASGKLLEASWESLESLVHPLGGSWGDHGVSRGDLVGSWSDLWESRGDLGTSWNHLGRFLWCLGKLLGG